MSPEALEAGYWRAYHDFYRWGSILHSAWTKAGWADRLRHVAYTGGWKKLEPMWDWAIRAGWVGRFRPVLEDVLAAPGRRPDTSAIRQSDPANLPNNAALP